MAHTRPLRTSQSGDMRRLVRDSHKEILELFRIYLGSPADSRQAIVEQILDQLESHLEMEEGLLIQTHKSGANGRKLVEVAEREQEEIKSMIFTLRQSEADDDQALDEFFEDMMQTVQAHFVTEERDILPLIVPSSDA